MSMYVRKLSISEREPDRRPSNSLRLSSMPQPNNKDVNAKTMHSINKKLLSTPPSNPNAPISTPRIPPPVPKTTSPSATNKSSTSHHKRIENIKGQVVRTAAVMQDNLQEAYQRGTALEDLEMQTAQLARSSAAFHKTTKDVQKKKWMEDTGSTFFIVMIVVGIVSFFVVLIMMGMMLRK